jgi:uncharacterized protein DUF6515
VVREGDDGSGRPVGLGRKSIGWSFTAAIAALVAASSFIASEANAQATTPHGVPGWVLADRFHRDYPEVGSTIPALAEGSAAVDFGGERFFFQAGVWYRASPAGYVVVDPPTDIVAPALPAGTITFGDAPYYYSTGIYYVAVPGGYAVTLPPIDLSVDSLQP